MLINSKRLTGICLLMGTLAACNKQNGFGPTYKDYESPDVPVTVQNAADYRPDPTVDATLSADTVSTPITITLQIPASSGRTIREITEVIPSSSYTAIQGSAGFFNSAPIPGNGTSVTFTTTVGAYLTFVNAKKTSVAVKAE